MIRVKLASALKTGKAAVYELNLTSYKILIRFRVALLPVDASTIPDELPTRKC